MKIFTFLLLLAFGSNIVVGDELPEDPDNLVSEMVERFSSQRRQKADEMMKRGESMSDGVPDMEKLREEMRKRREVF